MLIEEMRERIVHNWYNLTLLFKLLLKMDLRSGAVGAL